MPSPQRERSPVLQFGWKPSRFIAGTVPRIPFSLCGSIIAGPMAFRQTPPVVERYPEIPGIHDLSGHQLARYLRGDVRSLLELGHHGGGIVGHVLAAPLATEEE